MAKQYAKFSRVVKKGKFLIRKYSSIFTVTMRKKAVKIGCSEK